MPDEKIPYVPGHGYPVKVLYRACKVSIGGVEVILGPETELLVNDKEWSKIFGSLMQGFSDKEWEEGSGHQCRSIPTSQGQWKHPEERVTAHSEMVSARIAKTLKLDTPKEKPNG